jgi:serine/threonine-protein kinase HipA
LPDELLDFGRRVCGVADPARVVERIADAMVQTLAQHRTDTRVAPALHAQMGAAWASGLALASEMSRSQARV